VKKKLKVCFLVIVIPALGAWSLSLWSGYTVPLILHEDTRVKSQDAMTDLVSPLAGLDFDHGNWCAYLILDANDFRSAYGRFSRNCLKLTDREIMKRMRDEWQLTRTGGDAATVVSRIVFVQNGTVVFSSGISLDESGNEGLQSRYFGWAEPRTNGVLMKYCSTFEPVYWPVIVL